ncbi:MAG: AzlC family ABC transporter permease [Elusimicrobiota bacterium]|jgi:4-azaleucine resistance transporter AzlC|nr:AzlC family ABC transporter permease [Elusimicrobiota bacterium]
MIKIIFQVVKISLPVLFGYIAIGMPFGIMMIAAGYPFWLVPLMSIVIYAGAGQYMAVGLFAVGAGLSEILFAEALLNMRHIVYGLPLIESYKNAGKWKPYIIFALTDETYALLTTCNVPAGIKSGTFYGLISLFNHIYWIAGGVLGAIAVSIIPISFKGVDFALTALFAVLLIEQIKKTKSFLPLVIGAIVTITAIIFIPSKNILLFSICFGIVALMIFRRDNA